MPERFNIHQTNNRNMMFRTPQIPIIVIYLILVIFAVISPVQGDPNVTDAITYADPINNSVTVIAIGDEGNKTSVKYGIIRTTSVGTENVVVAIISDEPFSTGNNSSSGSELLHPGETRFFSDTISEDQTKKYVRVTYDTQAPVSLQVLTPDEEYGTYSDIDDGIEDNAIFMRIYSESGLDPGRWYYQVHLPEDASPVSFQIESWDE